MKSPFPGMDPYIERHWPDVQTSLVGSVRTLLNQRLPDDLAARAQEREGIEEEAHGEPAGRGRRRVNHVVNEPLTERFVEIIEAHGDGRLITVIEMLSVANKFGKGLEAFVRKREELLEGGVNFVEIDLQRAGDWRRLLHPHACPASAQATYRGVIRIPSDPHAAYLHPIPLREPLPNLKIPLRADDPPCELPLQSLVEEAYLTGRYGRTIDYHMPCDPPLEEADAKWADELLRAASRR
ncbi:MAG TPA: DUF4058 family protein [Tepidisphaeraceae bacterium]|nr:DUF4058 family protein [Tepidisphaeraceae bacterium]